MSTTYNCISDRYDLIPVAPYTLDGFLDMCREYFGEAPELREDDSGNLHDDIGTVLVVSESPRPGRPRTAPDGGRRTPRMIRATDAEWRALKAKAAEAGLTAAAFVRARCC